MAENQRKRCYGAWLGDDLCALYVAHSLKEAKKWAYCEFIYAVDSYIDVRAKCFKAVDVSDLEYGEMDLKEGLRRGAYAYLLDDCPVCGNVTELRLSEVDGKIRCEACEEERGEDV